MSKYEDAADNGSSEGADRASLARAISDFEAARARVERDAERLYDEKRRELVLQFLPVSDDLERTLRAAEAGSVRAPALVDALRMVHRELQGVLARYGLERIDAVGQRFDPTLHEAVATHPVVAPKLVGTVVQQTAPGYRFGGKLLRAARVSVGVMSSAVHARHSRAAS